MTPQGPLVGIRVLDFTRHLAGPYATTILGDFGADVVKIESVPDGDPARAIRTAGEDPDADGQAFITYNHGKRSIALGPADRRRASRSYERWPAPPTS